MPTVKVIISSEVGTILEEFIAAPSEAISKHNQPQNEIKLAEAIRNAIEMKFEVEDAD